LKLLATRCIGSWLCGRGFHDHLAYSRVSGIGTHCRGDNRLGGRGGSITCGDGFLCRLDQPLELPEDDDAVIALLEACPHDLELDLLTLLRCLKVWAANVEIAGKQNLERRHLGVDADLALEGHRDSERLPRMRHADIRLELYGVIQPALDKVCTSQRMFKNSNATVVYVALGDADAFIPVTKLSKKASFNIALKVLGVHMDIPDESTTFEERITHTVCSY
jgi:hypothetical protein